MRRLAHHFDFSNTVDNLIEVEELEDPSKSSEEGSTFGEEASSEEHSRDISNALGETETSEDSFDERATFIGEGQYRHTSQPTPFLVCSAPLSFFFIFHLSLPYVFHFSKLHRDQLFK